jgi:hypothetical protein
MKTFTAKDFSVNWQKPDAKGNFGKVFFGTQGMGGFGGQVVVKCPNSDQFALTVFNTEKAVNEKLDKSYSNPRWAKYLGDVIIDGTTPLPTGVGRTGLVYKREAGAGNSLEDFLLDGKDLAGKLGVRKETGIRPDLCKKVVGELLLTCVQMHKVGVIHRCPPRHSPLTPNAIERNRLRCLSRDVKPENVLVVGGGVPLKLIDFGSSSSNTQLGQLTVSQRSAPCC